MTVTGFSPFHDILETFNGFGLSVLLLLVQIGGLSVITISIFIMLLVGAKIGISDRFLIKESLNHPNMSKLVSLVKKIIITTFVIELTGFIINLFIFIPQYDIKKAILISLFHAVSSFNNAGFTLFGLGHIEAFNSNLLLNINTSLMIILGGLGFIVIHDILEKKSYKKLSNHSKIVIKTNLWLWGIGTLLFFLGQLNTHPIRVSEALFLSINAWSAGYYAISMQTISQVSILFLMLFMLIGASPSSTGGGIKTTTFYVIFKSIVSFARGKRTITNHRVIPGETKNKAFILLTLFLIFVFIGTAALLIFDSLDLTKALFETIGAIANTGLSLDVTPTLSIGSKITLSCLMFIGRVGPLVIIGIFNLNRHKISSNEVNYLEEKIMIG